MEVTMVVRALILSFGLAFGISSIGPLAHGLWYAEHGSFAAQVAIYSALGLMLVSASLLFTFRHLESRRPVVTLR